jgi:exonuclease SbcC
MIPLKLSLQNFLSYQGNTVLDMSHIHTAVITGDNGSGKSSLLDAMTYALFGVARGTSKSGDNSDRLIFNNESFCKVELDFELEDQTYKVLRKRDQEKQNSELDLLHWVSSEWKSMSGSTIKQTQDRILSLLKVNYELFTSSVMIMQGKADTFTQKDPSERKELLAEILQLDIYERLREKAIEKKKEISIRQQALKNFFDQNEEKHSQKILVQDKIKTLNELIAKKETNIKDSKEKLNQTFESQIALEVAIQKKKHLTDLFERENSNIASLQADKQNYLKQIEEAQKIILMQHEIETGYQRLVANINKDKKMNEDFEIRTRIEKKINEIKVRLSEEEHKLKMLKVEYEKDESFYLKEKSNFMEITLKIQKFQSEQKELERIKNKKDEIEQSKTEIQMQRATNDEKLLDFKNNLATVKEKIADLSKKMFYYESIIREEQNIEIKLKKIKENKARLEILNDEMKKEAVKIEVFKSQIDEAKITMVDLEEKLAILTKEESQKRCPLCGTPLTAQRETDLILNYKKELDHKKDSIVTNEARIKEGEILLESKLEKKRSMEEDIQFEVEYTEKKANLFNAKTQVRSLNEEIYSQKVTEMQMMAEIQRLESKKEYLKSQFATIDRQSTDYSLKISTESNLLRNLGELQAQLGKAIEAEQKLPLVTANLMKINRKLETKEYSTDVREDLEDLEKKLFEVHYDGILHKEIKKNIENFQYLESEKKLLSEKLNEKQILTAAITKLNDKINLSTQEINKIHEELKLVTVNDTELDMVTKKIREMNQEIEILQKERDELLRQHAQASENLANYISLEEEYEEKSKQNKLLLQEELLLSKAADIYSKNGIQSFIIENSLPEIETKANEILDTISDGRLQIYFKVQSKSKKGAMRETLDIEISNEGKTRPYELFSGGEKFKVDIAIRIAISYILANKSGAKLSLLMIDEGFGTQDKDGVIRFVECINRIKDDFKKIIVITHLTELRDYFETHIRVIKNNGSSQLEVN